MPEEKFLTAQLHELLLPILGQLGVVTLLSGDTGRHGGIEHAITPSIQRIARTMSDRYAYRINVGMSAVRSPWCKKRSGQHESTIREFQVDADGIHIGEPLVNFQGVLTGVPTYASVIPKK